MSSINNILAVYCTTGDLYLRWTLCSILSMRKNGMFPGDICVIVSSVREVEIAKAIMPDLFVLNSGVEVKGNVPKFYFKPLALSVCAEKLPMGASHVLFVDCDVFAHADIRPFLEKIVEAEFWVDRIYSEKKMPKYIGDYKRIIDNEENVEFDPLLSEYNSGLYLMDSSNN